MTTAQETLAEAPERSTPLAFGSTVELGRTVTRVAVIGGAAIGSAVAARLLAIAAEEGLEDARLRNNEMQLERCSSGPLTREDLAVWCRPAGGVEPLQYGPPRKGRGGKVRRW